MYLVFKKNIKQDYNKVKITSDTTIWNIELHYLKALTKTICYLLQSAENTTKMIQLQKGHHTNLIPGMDSPQFRNAHLCFWLKKASHWEARGRQNRNSNLFEHAWTGKPYKVYIFSTV